MESPPVAAFLEKYKLASGEGAVVELKLRLLADKVPPLQQFAHAQKLEDIENEVARYFGQALSEHPAVKLAKSLRSQGLSLGKISQTLSHKGLGTLKGAAFSAAQVQSFVRLT